MHLVVRSFFLAIDPADPVSYNAETAAAMQWFVVRLAARRSSVRIATSNLGTVCAALPKPFIATVDRQTTMT